MMDLFVLINYELAFIYEHMNEKLREAQQTFFKIAEDMKTAHNQFTIFEIRIEQVLDKRLNIIPSLSHKYSNQDHSKKHTTVLEEELKKVKKTLGSINNLMGGPGGLKSQILYIQSKTTKKFAHDIKLVLWNI